MALFPRSDLMSVSIPPSSGGCGRTHSRPVLRGAPAKEWKLECAPCEKFLRGDEKPKVIQVTPGDKDRGIPSRMVHVADSDPHWSTTPEGVPLTPDEQHIHKLRAEQGQRQLEMLQAYAALSKVPGLDLKDYKEAMWLLDQTLEPLKRPVVNGLVLCADGHENPASTKFCAECGMSMSAKGALETALDNRGLDVDHVADVSDPELVFVDLQRLHVATLRKMAREKGLPDKGTKAQLVERLS